MGLWKVRIIDLSEAAMLEEGTRGRVNDGELGRGSNNQSSEVVVISGKGDEKMVQGLRRDLVTDG